MSGHEDRMNDKNGSREFTAQKSTGRDRVIVSPVSATLFHLQIQLNWIKYYVISDVSMHSVNQSNLLSMKDEEEEEEEKLNI